MSGLSSRETGLLSEERVAAVVVGELEAGRALVVATVLATSRSVPRRPGSKMIVFADGRTVGSVGGGELEQRVIGDAMRSFMADDPEAATIRTCTYELVDVASGDPGVCGGTTQIIIEPKYPNPTLLIIGCGHVGRAVADLAAWLGFRVVANDDRPELATAALMPGAAIVVAGPVTDALAVANLDHRSSVVVVTRNVAVEAEARSTRNESGIQRTLLLEPEQRHDRADEDRHARNRKGRGRGADRGQVRMNSTFETT